jgi:hypothetical protein
MGLSLTVEQFLALPEDDRARQELIGGEVITTGRGGQPHEITKGTSIAGSGCTWTGIR